MPRSQRRAWPDAPAMLAAIGGAGLLGFAVTSTAWGSLAAVALLVVVDWSILAVTVPRRRATSLALTLSARVERGHAAQVLLEIAVTARDEWPAMRLDPLIPAAMTPLEPLAAIGAPGPREWRLVRRLRAERPGVHVFPGAVLHARSWMRLFRRSLVLTDRREVVVRPDWSATSHPRLARLLRSERSLADLRRTAQRGIGSDFRELREYHYPDPINRMDWKATARRGSLVVREFEAPREHTIRILLDGSLDLTHDGAGSAHFARAAAFVARLGYAGCGLGSRVLLAVYDRDAIVLPTGDGIRGFERLLGHVAGLPRDALLRASARHENVLPRRAETIWRRLASAWPSGDRAPDFERFLADYLPQIPERARPGHFLADFAPEELRRMEERCPLCGGLALPDEAGCPRCTAPGASGRAPALPIRAACLCDAIARAIRDRRGHELMVVISALQGGEACTAVADHLAVAARSRSVHVVLPTFAELSDTRSIAPGSLGNFPPIDEVVRDMERLARAGCVRSFRERLAAAGVSVHPLDDEAALDQLVADVLIAEIGA